MKSPVPSVDLSDMCSRLKDYKNALTGDDDYTYNSEQMEQISERIDRVFKKCDLAKDLEDVPTFLRRRERLMFLIAKYVLAA